MNQLDRFLDRGNRDFGERAGDLFTWDGNSYACTLSDLTEEMYLSDEGTGRRRDADKLLEIWLPVLPVGQRPKIRERITAEGHEWEIIEIVSLDTTNVVYRIRIPMKEL